MTVSPGCMAAVSFAGFDAVETGVAVEGWTCAGAGAVAVVAAADPWARERHKMLIFLRSRVCGTNLVGQVSVSVSPG